MIRLGYHVFFDFLDINIGPFATEQLHHRHLTTFSRPSQRRSTSLSDTKGKQHHTYIHKSQIVLAYIRTMHSYIFPCIDVGSSIDKQSHQLKVAIHRSFHQRSAPMLITITDNTQRHFIIIHRIPYKHLNIYTHT